MGDAAEDAIERDMAIEDWEERHPEEVDDPLEPYQYKSRSMKDKSQPVEAEVVSEQQAVAVRPTQGVATISSMEQSFALAVRQRELLSDYIKKQLVPGKHFYARGDQKPSLTKEGAEIILLPHSLAPDYELVAGPAEPPDGDQPYQITVKCTLRSKGDPNSFVGSGLGSAGSHKGFWKKYGKDSVWEYQPRQTDRYLCHNATMKMAQKSAMIAATINSTAASEFFTQDMEEDASPKGSATKPQGAAPERQQAASKPERVWTAQDYMDRFQELVEASGKREQVLQFLIDLGWLMPDEPLSGLPDRAVPHSKDEMSKLWTAIDSWAKDGKAVEPYPRRKEEEPKPKASVPHGTINVPRDTEPAKDDEPWRSFPVPFGQDAGVALEDLDKKVLYGWWANFEVTTEFKDKKTGEIIQKKKETIDKDKKFREMLDAAGEHYEFTKDDE